MTVTAPQAAIPPAMKALCPYQQSCHSRSRHESAYPVVVAIVIGVPVKIKLRKPFRHGYEGKREVLGREYHVVRDCSAIALMTVGSST